MKTPNKAKKPSKKPSTEKKPRGPKKDTALPKKPLSTEELVKLKQLFCVLESSVKEFDPFTTEEFSFILEKVFSQIALQVPKQTTKPLFEEYFYEPPKNKKSKNYSGFTENKKRFDILCNKEDLQQNELIKQRFQIYHKHIPTNQNCTKLLSHLSKVHKTPPKLRLSRKELLKDAISLNSTEAPQKHQVHSQAVLCEVLNTDPPLQTQPTNQEKLILLRGITKHLGNWHKIRKEFKESPKEIEELQQWWRRLKGEMWHEVGLIRKKGYAYHPIKWIRAVVKKLEAGLRNQLPAIIDATQTEKRYDILSVMAEAEKQTNGFEGNSSLPFSGSSCFKPFMITEQ